MGMACELLAWPYSKYIKSCTHYLNYKTEVDVWSNIALRRKPVGNLSFNTDDEVQTFVVLGYHNLIMGLSTTLGNCLNWKLIPVNVSLDSISVKYCYVIVLCCNCDKCNKLQFLMDIHYQ